MSKPTNILPKPTSLAKLTGLALAGALLLSACGGDNDQAITDDQIIIERESSDDNPEPVLWQIEVGGVAPEESVIDN